MVYLILIIGIVFGTYALYKFFLNATLSQIRAAFQTAMFIIFAGALLFLSVTGRLPAALALMGAISPFLFTILKKKFSKKSLKADETMSRKEALEILELQDEPSKEEIINAHKGLMKKNHPDQKGSEYFAKKINIANDLLLNDLGNNP